MDRNRDLFLCNFKKIVRRKDVKKEEKQLISCGLVFADFRLERKSMIIFIEYFPLILIF